MEQLNPKISRQKLIIGMLLLAVISGTVYMLTLCPTVYVGDSGELIAASWSLGVPHAPGYPLYTLLGYFFVHAPFGDNPAVRMNFMTALFSVGSVLVLYRLIVLFSKEYVISFAASLIYAFGSIHWSQSVTAEVYTLNNLVVCSAVLYIVLAAKYDKKGYLYLAAFLSGLALTTHQTSLLILPGGLWLLISSGRLKINKYTTSWIVLILLFVLNLLVVLSVSPVLCGVFFILVTGAAFTLYTGKKKNDPAAYKRDVFAWILTFAFYILGFAFYLYLPLAASRSPDMNWGDPSTLDNFMKTLLAPAFTQINKGVFIDHLKYFPSIFLRELNYIGLILAIIGICSALRTKSDPQHKSLAWIVLVYIVFFLITLKPDFISLFKLDVYYLPVLMFSALFIALGVKYLLERISEQNKISHKALLPVFLVLLLINVIWNLSDNRDQNNRKDNTLAHWYGQNILESCDENSILLCNFDDLFILFYLQKVLGIRPDVTTVFTHFPTRGKRNFWEMWLHEKALEDKSINMERSSRLFYKSYGVEEIIEEFIAENIDHRPVFFSFYKVPALDFLEINFRFEPKDFCYRVKKGGQSYDVIQKNRKTFSGEYDETFFRKLFLHHHNIEEDFILVRLDEIFRFNATLFNQIGNREDALHFLILATAVDPLLVENWLERSRLEEHFAMTDAAVNSIEQIIQREIQINPELSSSILNMRYEQAKILHRAGRNLEAAEILNRFYPLDSRKPRDIQQLAQEIEQALHENVELNN